MPDTITLMTVLTFLFWSFVFGFGFAIGGWLWNAMVAAVKQKRG